MIGFIVPIVDCYHNLTNGKQYDIVKVDKKDALVLYFYDDNGKLTVLVKNETTENSFEIHWMTISA